MQSVVRLRRPGVFLSLLAALLFCSTAMAADKKAMASKGDRLYTQFSFFYEGDHHITTNYRKGILVPINTEVEFVKSSRKEITVKLLSYDAEVKIVNEEGYSGEKIAGIFKRMFAPERIDLSTFSEAERSSIKKGIVTPGMSKDAVIKAMGYPPKHKTPSLEMDQWRYWKNRFDTQLVYFEDGKVSTIQD